MGDAAEVLAWYDRLRSAFIERYPASETERRAIDEDILARIGEQVERHPALLRGDANAKALRSRSARLYRGLAMADLRRRAHARFRAAAKRVLLPLIDGRHGSHAD